MARESALTLFLGEDHQFVYSILNEAQDAAIDISGWALSWMVKRNLLDADASALLTKTTGGGGIVVSGTYNSNPDVNTQVATITLLDTDSSSLAQGLHHYELKRTDDGFETVLGYGRVSFVRGVHR